MAATYATSQFFSNWERKQTKQTKWPHTDPWSHTQTIRWKNECFRENKWSTTVSQAEQTRIYCTPSITRRLLGCLGGCEGIARWLAGCFGRLWMITAVSSAQVGTDCSKHVTWSPTVWLFLPTDCHLFPWNPLGFEGPLLIGYYRERKQSSNVCARLSL